MPKRDDEKFTFADELTPKPQPQPTEEKKQPREDDLTWLEHWHQLERELSQAAPKKR
jgi:hypothetical protein